ncbi:IclR family transcriptional regulator [Bordetella bronchiseptica]|uniref:IclR family transcriptional regulator n=1 Tax=Bordetella bronchiseptica TaxID=518 RepID=UPI000460C706|nr:IclR family transcriptional regulator [Bordetella bronchiseptica]KDC22330.1 transcriptional regulator, IclR family, C-terminal domain protein [Bordetella bronchiseptica F-1]KDC28948.1 transcriptional regulator, IclR family, C-terminal domain protein [Bordetella bronchiseptica F2]KDD42684.1 transcriptional regulator, IclR family, C-terminal domain protein [Bordetella bronchiseptica MBORD901]
MKLTSTNTGSSRLRNAPAPETEDEHGASPSVAHRTLAILQAVSATDIPLAAADLAAVLDFPKPTIHRLMLQLEEIGFLEREPGGKRFIAGRALTEMAVDTLIFSPHRAVRHAILQALVEEVQETCNITTLSGNEVIYVDRVEAHWPLRYHMQAGSRVPMHCSASGRLFLSFMPARKRRALLTAVPLKKYTANTIVDPDQIEQGFKEVRATELSVDVEEFMEGLIGIAVPVYDGHGRICATVSMHAPSLRCSVDKALSCAPALKRAAAAIGSTLQETGKD